MNTNRGFLAVDVGSSRVKLGWFPPALESCSDKPANNLPIAALPLPEPSETLAVPHEDHAGLWATIATWLHACCPEAPPGVIASVHPAALAIVQEMFAGRLRTLAVEDLPLKLRVEHPERVGIDRLLSAVAVNRIRQAGKPALVIDLGTACTVDLIAPDGAFEGGAIFPGVFLSATALHTGTAALPQLAPDCADGRPAPVGKSTREAIAAGLFWGTIGAVRELVERISQQTADSPQLFFTGGGAPQLVSHFLDSHYVIRHIPHMVLAGMAVAVDKLATSEASEEVS